MNKERKSKLSIVVKWFEDLIKHRVGNKVEEPIWRNSASALANDDFVCIKTYCGYRLMYVDPTVKPHMLDPGVSDEILGVSVIEALNRSRAISLEESKSIRSQLIKNANEWAASLKKTFGYKSDRALFRNMKNCEIHRHNDLITIMPTRHEKLDVWSREKNDGILDVIIPADSKPAEIGSALRIAFSRCK